MRSHTNTYIKICGLTRVDQALSIAKQGANAIGVVGVKDSPRYLGEKKRRKLFSSLGNCSPGVERVWVIADMDENCISDGLHGDGIPSIVQLHGHETNEQCTKLRLKFPNTKWWKACRVRSPHDLQIAKSSLL